MKITDNRRTCVYLLTVKPGPLELFSVPIYDGTQHASGNGPFAFASDSHELSGRVAPPCTSRSLYVSPNVVTVTVRVEISPEPLPMD